jgi:hypothetical protein
MAAGVLIDAALGLTAARTAAMFGFRATATRHVSGDYGSGVRISWAASDQGEVERGAQVVALLCRGARAVRGGAEW